ncbi:MAG: ROK family glucokinase [Oscillospiraceae bacterium]|nr:ROK family glucokinase [Oscillospiraceae bacterium]
MKYGFGVDVGGTTVKIGLFDQTGTLLEGFEIPTHTENGGERILPEIASAIDGVLARHGIPKADVEGVGIGVPGPVAPDGTVNRCVNLNWGVFNLHKTLGELTGLRVKGGNDANCAALGEHWKGGGMGCRSTVFVTLGTGVGGGVIIDGKVLEGAHGVGGEIGHITVNAPDRVPCTCGKRGCVEQYASANGVVRMAKERLASSEEPTALRGKDPLTCKDVFAAAKSGDRFAEEVLEQAFDYLGEALASACCVADPERIILGGGMSKAGDYLLERVEKHFKKYMFHACKGTEFSLAALGNDAGMYGAYRLLITEGSEEK